VAGSTSNPRADPAALKALLARDPAWAAYLIADLAPPHDEHSTWFLAGEAVVLLYRAFDVPVLTALGPAAACAPLWREALAAVPAASRVFAVCMPAHRPFVDAMSPFEQAHAMFRMRLEGDPPPEGGTDRLGLVDLPALRALYEDGRAAGEMPDFFEESMLEGGSYHGVRDESCGLLAAAGTHVATREVAAIGNVYTRRDARGRGLAGRATAAVAHDLRARGSATIVLNVRQDNRAAIRVYERLGFVVHGAFDEGFARPAPGSAMR
jgi:GNAT superfamily N-acetyltransferase